MLNETFSVTFKHRASSRDRPKCTKILNISKWTFQKDCLLCKLQMLSEFAIVNFTLTSSTFAHCSKSSFFVQKFQLWFPEKNCRILGENSWKCCGFGLFSCWQLWFHMKNYLKKFGWKTRKNVGDLHILIVDAFDFPRKIVKFCQNWIFLTKNLTFGKVY